MRFKTQSVQFKTLTESYHQQYMAFSKADRLILLLETRRWLLLIYKVKPKFLKTLYPAL